MQEEKMLPASLHDDSRGQSITLSSLAKTGSLITCLDDVERVAKLAVASKFFKNAEDISKAVMVMMYGIEKGLSAVDSLSSIYVINGKFSMYAASIASRLTSYPGVELVPMEFSKDTCTLALHYKKKLIGLPVTFTVEMAKAGEYYQNNKNWRSDPESMLWARCVTRIHKRYGGPFMNGLTVEAVEDMQDVVLTDEAASQPQPEQKPFREPDRVTKEMIEEFYQAAATHQDMPKKNAIQWILEYYRVNKEPDAPEIKEDLTNFKDVFPCGMYHKALERIKGAKFFPTPKPSLPKEVF
jgi:hypothetical protein